MKIRFSSRREAFIAFFRPIIASERVTEAGLTSSVLAEVAVDWIFLFLAAVGIFQVLIMIGVMEITALIL